MLTRRTLIAGAPPAPAACASMEIEPPAIDPTASAMYGRIDDEPWSLPAIDLSAVSPALLRQEVASGTVEPVGTVVVDPAARFLYRGERAIRIGIGIGIGIGVGVGKVEAFDLTGVATVDRKAEWPSWRSTDSMIAREPERYGPQRDSTRYAGGEAIVRPRLSTH